MACKQDGERLITDRIEINLRFTRGQNPDASIPNAPATVRKGAVAASDSGAIPERFKGDSDLQERFGIAGMWVSERFERDHFPLV